MNYKHPIEIATITTESLAYYLYKAIGDLDIKVSSEFKNVRNIEDYLDLCLESTGYSNLFSNVLEVRYGLNHNFGNDYFDTEKDLKAYVFKNDLIMINESLAVCDLSDNPRACEKALLMLEEDREHEDYE